MDNCIFGFFFLLIKVVFIFENLGHVFSEIWSYLFPISPIQHLLSPTTYSFLTSCIYLIFLKLTPVRVDLMFTGMEPSAQWKPTRADSSTKDGSPSPSNCLVLTASKWYGMVGFWLAWSCAHNRGTSFMTVSNMSCVKGDCPLDHTLFSFPLSWCFQSLDGTVVNRDVPIMAKFITFIYTF